MSDIELYPELVKDRQDTYNSLTDLAGINIFTDEFREISNQVKEAKVKYEQKIKEEVFAEEILQKQNREEKLISQLFINKEETVLQHDYLKNNEGWSFMDTGLVLICVLAVSALYLFFFHDKKSHSSENSFQTKN